MGGIVKNAPNSLIWAVVVAFLGVVTAFSVLAALGADTTSLRQFLNLAFSAVGALGGSGALVVAGAAAKSAGKAEEHGNGNLTAKDNEIQRLRSELQTMKSRGWIAPPVAHPEPPEEDDGGDYGRALTRHDITRKDKP